MPREWLVKLSGVGFDLRELSEYFSYLECQVIVEDDKYYLKSIRFNSLTEADEVTKEAENLVRMINGLDKLKLSNWGEIKIAGIAYFEDSYPWYER